MLKPRLEHAAVLGGGVAGLLTAFALAEHARTVSLVEQDAFDEDPASRRGAPHARQIHVLVSGGARAIDQLAPGLISQLCQAGAQHLNIPGRYLGLTPQGWHPRYTGEQFIIGCSRGLLESTLRARLATLPNVTVLDRTGVSGLLGDTRRITGAQLQDRPLSADLVVDATGRRSQATRWLAELGYPAPPESVVDPGIFYATGRFRAPAGITADFPAVSVQTSPLGTGQTRRGGLVLPIEDEQWLVTLGGARGDQPSTDPESFREFAAGLPHPAIAQFIAAATPLGPVIGFRADANRRRHYERLRPAPTGFLVLGDAYATFNPIYGHGMSVAALSALTLRNVLRRNGAVRTLELQQQVAKASHTAWVMATAQDLRFPQTRGPMPGRLAQLVSRVQDRISAAGAHNKEIAAAQLEVFALAAPPSRLLNRHVLLGALLGSRQSARTEPPFTDRERALLDLSGG